MEITWKRILNYSLTFTAQVLFIVIYTVVGGIVFKAYELEGEQLRRSTQIDDVTNNRTQLIEKIKNITDAHYENERHIWFRKVKFHLKAMEKRLDVDIDTLKEDDEYNWSFYGSVFFSATVITTIGYGHIAPVTTGGRIFCMAYAVFGISLLLLVLASIGSLLARGATLTYRQLHNRMKKIQLGKEQQNEDYPYYGRSNSGYHQQNGTSPHNEVIQEIWGTIKFDKDGKMIIPESAKALEEDEGGDKPMPNEVKYNNETNQTKTEVNGKQKVNEDDHVVVSGGQFGAGDDSPLAEEEEVNIPVYIVLLLAFVYVILLAALLVTWEETWSFFDAIYFSFVTLTTIGFGDLVPQHQKNLLSCTVLIILGMAIMSMCIALAQEMIMRKIAWLSQKVGVALIKQDTQQTPTDDS